MTLVFYLITLAVLLGCVFLDKASHFLTAKELKRRSRSAHDANTSAIYHAVCYGRSLYLLLWLLGGLSATSLIISAAHHSSLLALVMVLAIALLSFGWNPRPRTDGWLWTVAAIFAKGASKLLSMLQPLLGRAEELQGKLNHLQAHAGVYEKEDLLELLDQQKDYPENRVPQADLKLAHNALTFGDKQVSDAMTPLRAVRMVNEHEEVGPLLMDELHSTGFSRFPVMSDHSDKSAPAITGTLYIKELIDRQSSAKVKDVMDHKVYFVNETQNLRQALDAFLKTHHHLFIVVNNFEELVGVVSIEDVLEQLLGSEIVDEFDRYDDMRAVASIEAKKEHAAHRPSHPQPVEPLENPVR